MVKPAIHQLTESSRKSFLQEISPFVASTVLLIATVLILLQFLATEDSSPVLSGIGVSLLALAALTSGFVVITSIRNYWRNYHHHQVLSGVINDIADMVIVFTPDGSIKAVNEITVQSLGFSRSDLLKMKFWDLDMDCYLRRHPEQIRQIILGKTLRYETEYYRYGGGKVAVESHVCRYDWRGEACLIEVARDIRERRETEQQLLESNQFLERLRNRLETRVQRNSKDLIEAQEERLRAEKQASSLQSFLESLVDAMPSMVITVDSKRMVTQWNHTASKITGIQAVDAIGAHLHHLLPELDALAAHALSDHEQINTRLECLIKDRSYQFDVMAYCLSHGEQDSVVLRVDDVTERTRIEELLVQSEKMMSLGGLAAGMAHEINNPLGAIMQSSQNIKRRLSLELKGNKRKAEKHGLDLEGLQKYLKEQQIIQFLDGVLESGNRAAAIVKDMLSFARPGQSSATRFDLAEALDRSLRMAKRDLGHRKDLAFHNIRMEGNYLHKEHFVFGQRTQLEQVVLNLIANAAQAFVENPEQHVMPCITLSTRSEQDKVYLFIDDNGPGMDDEVRKRIFEPFFTTKSETHGTGLGLSVSYFIVTELLKGQIDVSSTLGKGTRFRICLPTCQQSVVDAVIREKRGQFELPFE